MPFIEVLDDTELAPPSDTLLRELSSPRSAVIVGPPGSGKTALAVHLARIASRNSSVQFLVASTHLVEWLRSVVKGHDIEVSTWRTWLSRTFLQAAGTTYPVRTTAEGRQIDWDAALKVIETSPPGLARQVFIDEAQDMPSRLVAAVARHAGNLVAFADPLQRHSVDGSTVEELVKALGVDHPWPVYVLEEDFRTTREIQRFATLAWAPERLDPSRPARRRGEDPRVVHGGFEIVANEAAELFRLCGRGIAVASSHADRAPIAAAVRAADLPLNRGTKTDPEKISVLAFEALRGLEFDGVVLVPPESPSGTWNETASDLYVAATRAKKMLRIVIAHPPFANLEASLERTTGVLGDS